MAILETLEGDTMEPEILCAGGPPSACADAKFRGIWEPTMADVLHRKPRRPALTSGMAKLRAAAANKGTATLRPVRRIPARGAAGARPWGQSSGRFVMVGDEFDPESLEGWLTDLKKGAGKAVRAVGNVGSAIVRPVASVGLNVLRSTAPIAGSLIGSAVQSSGILGPLASAFGMGGSSTAAAPEGTPAAMPAPPTGGGPTGGGIPPIYLIGGGALLLVLLLRNMGRK